MAHEPSLQILLTGEKFTPSPKLEKYVHQKLQGLEKYIPRAARESAQIEVRLKQTGAQDKQINTCDLTLLLPTASLHARETTGHMYAALDVATANIHHQITEYKSRHEPATLRHRLGKAFGKGQYPS